MPIFAVGLELADACGLPGLYAAFVRSWSLSDGR
jgi:hypothetical protein